MTIKQEDTKTLAEMYWLGYVLSFTDQQQKGKQKYRQVMVQTVEALEYARLGWKSIPIEGLSPQPIRKRIHDGVTISNVVCITLPKVCQQVDAKEFEELVKAFWSYHYQTLLSLLKQDDVTHVKTWVWKDLGIDNLEDAICVIGIGSSYHAVVLNPKEALKWKGFHHRSWTYMYSNCLPMYCQYCETAINCKVKDKVTGLRNMSRKHMETKIKLSKKFPEMWLEPHDIAHVNQRFAQALRDKRGANIIINEKDDVG